MSAHCEIVSPEGQLVEHGDLLSVCKRAQEGCVARLEP